MEGILLIGGHKTSDSIEIYDPKKPSENQILPNKLMFHRFGHISELFDDNIIIAGGGTTKDPLQSSEIFHISHQKQTIGPVTTIGHAQAASTVHQGKIYIFGGLGTPICEKFDDKWSSIATLKRKRHGSAAVSVGGNIYLLGGERTEGLGPFRKQVQLSSVKTFNPALNIFNKTTKMNSKRSQLAATTMNNNTIFVSGGLDNQNRELKSCEKMDVRKGSWSKMTPMNSARYGHVITVFDGNLIVIGGSPSTACNTVEQYDMRMDKWILLGHLKSERMDFSAVSIP